MTTGELIERFIQNLRTEKGYSDHTIRNYGTDLRQFLDFLTEREQAAQREGAPDIESVDFRTIRDYLGGYRETV